MRISFNAKTDKILFSIIRWIIFGVFALCLPSMITILIRWVGGYTIEIKPFMEDTCIITMSVSVNIIDMCIDENTKMFKSIRLLLCALSAVVVSISIVIYYLSYVSFFENEKNMCTFTYVLLGIVAFFAIIGIVVKIKNGRTESVHV